jgi:hypothetical protein
MNILYLAMSTLTADHYVLGHTPAASLCKETVAQHFSIHKYFTVSFMLNVFGCAGEILYDGVETIG